MTIGHNSIEAQALTQFIERIERLEDEKRGIADDIKDVYAEAKAHGFDPKIMREVVKLRKMEDEKRREREALIETYLLALGVLVDTPLGQYAIHSA